MSRQYRHSSWDCQQGRSRAARCPKPAGKADPGAVVSSESFAGYEVLADLARSVGVDVAYEVVPPPGNVHLNRANLIVIGGPRLLPFLAQVMEADRHLGFLHDEHGWSLADKNTRTTYRSPIDSGEPGDYAYLGRLPRPDGAGSFLYLAGIHAPGILGAAQYVADNLAELHRALKTRRFSVLISCQFHPADRRKILSTGRLTPLYGTTGPKVRVTASSEPGSPDAPNEDAFFASPDGDTVAIFDGSTARTGTGCIHGVAWYTHSLAGTLASHVRLTPAKALAAAITDTAARHRRTCDLAHPGTPSAAVAIVQARRKSQRYLLLADVTLVLDLGHGIRVLTDSRVHSTARAERQAADNLPSRTLLGSGEGGGEPVEG